MGPTEWGPVLWKYENCDMSVPAQMGREFKAEISV
jgi:hypothetical protein